MRFTVRVHPGARADSVGGHYGDGGSRVLVVRVRARAVDGRANDAVVRALAGAFDVPARDVTIVTGHTSRSKAVSIAGDLDERLSELLATST
jgi:uncharacterized protein